ncbi:unnamed protein product [Haemonchus placei]|uniref:Uncharacterized protein n=1 Tax=Haemonchus placei TaxID=6290 RepID=A0A0N4WHH6_HAEPC|nr:unnamed protein product [Haemonchus placei]
MRATLTQNYSSIRSKSKFCSEQESFPKRNIETRVFNFLALRNQLVFLPTYVEATLLVPLYAHPITDHPRGCRRQTAFLCRHAYRSWNENACFCKRKTRTNCCPHRPRSGDSSFSLLWLALFISRSDAPRYKLCRFQTALLQITHDHFLRRSSPHSSPRSNIIPVSGITITNSSDVENKSIRLGVRSLSKLTYKVSGPR